MGNFEFVIIGVVDVKEEPGAACDENEDASNCCC